MPLKILYHHRTQGRGAEGLHISRIVQALRELGHEVVVVSPPGIDPLAPKGETTSGHAGASPVGLASLWKWVGRNLPGFMFEFAEVAYNVPAYFRLRRLLASQKFDLIYERYAFFLLAGVLLARRFEVPFVLEANEVSGIELRVRKQSFPRICVRFERRLFAGCAAIHTVSSYLKRRIVDAGVPAERVFVAPNAFDVRAIADSGRSESLTSRFGLRGKQVIGFAGWFSDWDRLDFLIDVVHQLKPAHPSLALLLIGDGPMVPELRQQIERLGLVDDVVFTGPVPRAQVYEHIALLDVAVLPHSNRFGSPVVMFEFMGLKIPVVAPRLEPIQDVQEHGRTALLFDPLDKEQCVSAIAALLRDPPLGRRLAGTAYDKLLVEHTWIRNAEAILASVGLR
jgi:glycosyltransferase involved in cell wall biosynthesis